MPASPPADATLTDLATFVTRELDRPAAPGEHQVMIESAARLIDGGEARLHSLVATARHDDVSWQSIGESLGVSRQAAFKRFGGLPANESGQGSASNQRIDLLERTTTLFTILQSGDYATVRSLMTYTCARALTKRHLMGVWNSVIAASGRFEGCVEMTAQLPEARSTLERLANRHLTSGTVVQTTLRHESGEWLARVAYNGAGKITGIVIAPPGSQDLPF